MNDSVVQKLTDAAVDRHLHDEMSDEFIPYIQTNFDLDDSFERFSKKNNVTIDSLNRASLPELDEVIKQWRDWLLADGYIGWDTHS